MNHMSDKFSVQMADSFEKVITPTFQKMNESLDVLVNSVTRCQQDAVKDILDVFMKEMRTSFQIEFSDFNKALEEMTKAQKDNIAYTNVMYQTMVDQLSETYAKQEKAMKEMAADFEKMLTRFIATTARITQDNQAIQKQQQQDYQHVVDYMKESERTSAKFWVACNQAMQKYVESASNSVDKIAGSSEASGEMLKSNKRLVEEFNIKMKEYTEYQKLYGQTMEQVRRLLSDVTVAKNNKEIYLMGGGLAHASDRETLRQLQNTLREQSERQEALLEEINSNIRELSRAAQKGKFSLFK
jgi:predicted NBD/HSP70 family sugar kinase